MHIFLFGGTTEGRKLAEYIAGENRKREAEGREDFLETEVFVATDYGAGLLPKERHISVHVGRLNADEMAERFKYAKSTCRCSVRKKIEAESNGPTVIDEFSIDGVMSEVAEDKADEVLVLDATHPYAIVVTENIIKACRLSGVGCIRVNRPKTVSETENADFLYFDNVKSAAQWLASTFNKYPEERKHILITTGSKEIREYTVISGFEEYCYVRALPTPEVLDKCMELGFRRDRLILMQGPFDVDMNLAQMRYASAGYIVTKDSGEIGGFPEKCDAAIELGVKVLVIGRPVSLKIQEEDRYRVMSLSDVFEVLK
ncbi:precorrin-6A/cobalt-precorrin-6A reductase [Oribacterium sp. WCC10]|uniref:precorrin-6A/cobalt-precorrin-6A reductase n=1 Tax=Oribacterium sp. WCC10 TaxID=1855343 RepID=UPI0008ECBB2A|nr:precorrin-6A/cobalt-precorrin-6A reductase [Oribacterium sp. WCC10]SFG74141.1 precorrin-6x reductase [Oribacterium sp. WCC10]